MHAQLDISLKSNVESTVLSSELRRHFGRSMLPFDFVSEEVFLGSHLPQSVGVVCFPDGAVMVFLHIAADELMVRVQGKSISELKERCGKTLRQLLAFYYFAPSTPPIASAVIATAAAIVGVLAESLLTLRGAKSWKWKESI